MAFLEARLGPPPGLAGSAIVPCIHPRGFLVIQVRNRRANGQPVLANTDIKVRVEGYPGQDLTTDGNGLVTLVYDAAADFANAEVAVFLRAPTRLWEGRGSTAGVAANPTGVANQTAAQISVPVAGTFTLKVRVTTRRPGEAADIRWVRAWNTLAAQVRRVTTPDAAGADAAVDTDLAGSADPAPAVELTIDNLDCVSSHDVSIQRILGVIDASCQVRLSVDGVAKPVASAVNANHDQVQYSSQDNRVLRLAVERHGAVIDVEYFVQFKQFLIVGEGTSYEYAVNLAQKFGDASNVANEFKWIVVTQYDVVLPGAVSDDMMVLNGVDGTEIHNHNQRQSVQAALDKNMIRRNTQFDATILAHWQNVLATYGAFDACIFNNPHIGYGMHMCVVMGLTQWRAGNDAPSRRAQNYASKNGMAVSVYSLGYNGAPLSRPQLDPLLGTVALRAPAATVKSIGRQRDFVRGNGGGRLNHLNAPDTVVFGQYDPADCSARNIDIQTAFVYESDRSAIVNYGALNEFANNNVQTHYSSVSDTLGLQGYLLRCYRHYGPTVVRAGGWLYIHGSVHWSRELTAGFTFGVTNEPAMANIAPWDGRDTFVHYNTNFTSNDHHPSWYSQWNFNPGEPNIENALVFGRQC
ncbi:hypothetical protein [Pseudomonas sp. Irchel 3E13]|uniref:hypothetical protein n=1 Tax=Pseudomonas sp. Irchel 3E13 TaxID=2008975 RepID=UPI000BA37373|nr:hypothetical protein [Pseudomonas sp. Irchel 3E13]